MEFNKCKRCGNFYVTEGDVCPRCNAKDNFEQSTFKSYVEKNGVQNSIDSISVELGIPARHLNRYLGYKGFEEYAKGFNNLGKEEL